MSTTTTPKTIIEAIEEIAATGMVGGRPVHLETTPSTAGRMVQEAVCRVTLRGRRYDLCREVSLASRAVCWHWRRVEGVDRSWQRVRGWHLSETALTFH